MYIRYILFFFLSKSNVIFLHDLTICYLIMLPLCRSNIPLCKSISCYLVKIIRVTQRLIADKVKWIARKLFRAIYNHDWCGAARALAILWCIAVQYTRIQRTWSTPLARNPSDSPELYLYLICYATGIKGITVYRCFFRRKFIYDGTRRDFKRKARTKRV